MTSQPERQPKRRPIGRPVSPPGAAKDRQLVVRLAAVQTTRLREAAVRMGLASDSEAVRRLIDAAALCPAEALADFLAAGARGSVQPD